MAKPPKHEKKPEPMPATSPLVFMRPASDATEEKDLHGAPPASKAIHNAHSDEWQKLDEDVRQEFIDAASRLLKALCAQLRPLAVDGEAPETTLARVLEAFKSQDGQWMKAVEEKDAANRALLQAQEALKSADAKLVNAKDDQERLALELAALEKQASGAAVLDLIAKDVDGSEVRGVLVHCLPDQHDSAVKGKPRPPAYDNVGGAYEVVKLTIRAGSVEVEKMRELHDGKADTRMAWHVARDHAERLMEAHVVPGDYR